MTVQEAKLLGKSKLTSSPSPALDTECLLMAILKMDKTSLLFHPEIQLNSQQQADFLDQLQKRSTGFPIAYILGHKEFYGYDFMVNPSVLIPKPDTEILVEEALNCLPDFSHKDSVKILDMCTGSGCVGISILKTAIENKLIQKGKSIELTLADISPEALDLAQKNCALIPEEFLKQVKLVQTNLFEKIQQSFDMIVSNPPYIPATEAQELLKDGRSEPILALDGDIALDGKASGQNDGLGIMRNLVPQAWAHLEKNGVLLCESGEYNALKTEEIFKSTGFEETKIFCDLEGQLRVTKGIKK